MSDDDNPVNMKLTLDSDDFNNSVLQAQDALGQLGSGDQMSGLIDSLSKTQKSLAQMATGDGGVLPLLQMFGELGLVIGTVGLAAAAFVGAFKLTEEGENVEALNQQFSLLAANAGLSANTLKEAFIQAAGGMVTDAEAIQLANNAIVKLGANANQIPAMMELARKSAVVMGTDVQTSFNNLTQAIASGNQRLLKRIGIQVDVTSAEINYAKQLNTTVDALTPAQNQQAIMNAVLDEGNKKFAGLTESMKPATTAWIQFKVAVGELTEAIAHLFAKTLGGPFKMLFNSITDLAKYTKDEINGLFGTTSEKVDVMSNQLERLKKEQAYWNAELAKGSPAAAANLNLLNSQIDILTKKTAELKKSTQAEGAGAGGLAAQQQQANKSVEIDAKASAAKLAEEAKYQKQLQAMKKTEVEDDLKIAQTSEQLTRAEMAMKEQMAADHESKLAAIRAKEKSAEITHSQAVKLMAQEQETYTKQVEIFDQGSLKRRETMLENYQSHATNIYDGIARAAMVSSAKAQIDLQNSAKQGQKAFDTMSKGVTSAFEQMGAGAVGGSHDIEHALLGMIGSVSEQYGTMMLLASQFPPSPSVAAAGIALIVLGGALGAIGTSSASATTPTSSSLDTSSGSTASESLSQATPSATSSSQQQTSSVSINIQGSIFDSAATGSRIVDLVRQASDSTDYAVVQVGYKPYGS